MNLKDCELETTIRKTVWVSLDADNFLAAKVYARSRWDLFDEVSLSCKM